jgi:16S rRNA (guanine527-N7)-methyltransferase
MDALVRRATEVGLSLNPSQAARAWSYFQLLAKWNERMNLTGLRVVPDNVQAIDRLLIEPMLAATYARPVQRMVDVGSGGGSPAVPFALALDPNPVLTMVESRERKSVFLREAAREVGLASFVNTGRFEDFAANSSHSGLFQLLTIRAVRLDEVVLAAAAAVLAPGGQVIPLHEMGREDRPANPSISWQEPVRLLAALDSWLTVGSRT